MNPMPLTVSPSRIRTLAELGPEDLPLVGGKAAHLGELIRAGATVPPGFCITTDAFADFIAALPHADAHFAALEALDGESLQEVRAAAESIRHALEALPIPFEVARETVGAWRALGSEAPLAVRSSATAEDLPGASFAGQQDTYLNVRGEAALLEAIRSCWISLFTDRAVQYRARGGFGHRGVRLAVVVQRLIDPDVSGILFTADPISGHRRIASIDAGFGLGEALVSGLISADLYRVDRRTREILLARPGDKALAIRSTPGGGTTRVPLSESQRQARALDDAQVQALVDLGERIEAEFGGVPQDIEWCIAEGRIQVVQARPITSLFPIPEVLDEDAGLRVFLSFGHFQMMLDPMPRLAIEVWQYFFPAGKDGVPTLHDAPARSRVVTSAGGRIYLDVTPALRVPRARKILLSVVTHVYEALGRSLSPFLARPELMAGRSHGLGVLRAAVQSLGPVMARLPGALLFQDPAKGAARFTRDLDAIPREAADRIRAAGTPEARIRQSAVELNVLFRRVRPNLPRILSGVIAHLILRRMARGRWAEPVRGEVDLLLRGLPGNVTTEMDLEVGDLTDLLRAHPELATLVRTRPWSEARLLVPGVPGGREFADALERFLVRYGNRGSGEIDVSRPRWRDDPSLLLRVMTGGLSLESSGGHRRQHQSQVAAGEAAAERLVEAAGRGPLGALRRAWVRRLTRVVRLGLGLREHPKFMIVQVLAVIRSELIAAGERLAQRGQLADRRDVWHLGFEEVATALEDPKLDLRERASVRAEAFRRDQGRKAPIAISSDGEISTGAAERSDLPEGALGGTAASAGVVEGVARVVLNPDREVLQAGEILVAPFTDPGWTPLFVHAAGVVTEVGGMMTHGAVVAREYGIPAVVSVAGAVERIKTGQRIRVDGTRGFVEILDGP